MRLLEAVNLRVDELEAVRLADFEGLYQEAAAEKMHISRQTFGRILESAHKKIADALVNGKALSIEGGDFRLDTAPAAQASSSHFGAGRQSRRGRGRGHRGGRGNR